MKPTDRKKTHSDAMRSAGCAHAAANSGCSMCSMAVSATEVTALIRLTQHEPVRGAIQDLRRQAGTRPGSEFRMRRTMRVEFS